MSSSRLELNAIMRVGAFVYWMLSGFKKGQYKQQAAEIHDDRNMWTGYLTYLLILGIIIYAVIL